MLQEGLFRWRSWSWVVFVCFLSIFVYFQAIKEKKRSVAELASRIDLLQKEKASAQELREELLLAVGSQEDPAWIEMILMRDLGVVPEGWLKVHFKR